ncbi:hypothetical protein C8R44DRAFT_623698, partial [Mycena epipterygia]
PPQPPRGQNPQPSSSSRHKRRRTDAGPSDPEPTQEPPSKKTRREKTGKKPQKPKNWKIIRKQVPDDAVGLQKALHLHLRVSMNLLSQRAVPRRLTAQQMAPFEARFSSADDINTQLSGIIGSTIPPTNDVYRWISEFLRTIKAMSSQTARDAVRIGEQHLRVIFNAIANTGLHAFAPDVFGNVESMYNLVHEHLAIHTFRAIAVAWAYSFCECNISLLNDYNLLHSFYRSFIYGYMREQARKEDGRPGRLLTWRTTQIYDDCFSPTVARLAGETDCHSDDEEPIPGTTDYLIHEKPGRDAAVTEFFGVLTKRNVPIDYFSPEFFNNLSVRQRASYMKKGIALPTANFCKTWEDVEKWKGLSRTAFMAQYGNAKRALYKIPTAEELARLNDPQSMDEDDD